jgi:hypothetical protein
MSKNSGNCECGKPKYMGREICYDCYQDVFKDSQIKKTTTPKEEEPDFELKHDVAEISPSKNDTLYFTDGQLSALGIAKFSIPKQYVFNHDVRVKDYEKLVEFILENMYITDQSKGLDKVRWMFKEVEKN